MNKINDIENTNNNAIDLSVSNLMNSSQNYVNETTIHKLREDANMVIEEKINEGVIDPQALPLIKDWLNELYLLECAVAKRDRLLKEYKAIESKADRFAQNIVFIARKERSNKIKEEHRLSIKRIEKVEDEETQVQREAKRYIKDSKRAKKKIKAAKKKRVAEAELDKLEEKIKRENIQENQLTEERLHQTIEKQTESAYKIQELEKELSQKEHEASLKRAKKNAEIEASFDKQKKEWAIKQEKMEKLWKNQDKAMTADYAARIAKSERKMAEELQATHEAREKAFAKEKLQSEKFQEALNVAEKAGKAKAKIKNIEKSVIVEDNNSDSVKNDSENNSSKLNIDEYYENAKSSWRKNSVEDREDTIKILEAIKVNESDKDEVAKINNKIGSIKRAIKIIENNNK